MRGRLLQRTSAAQSNRAPPVPLEGSLEELQQQLPKAQNHPEELVAKRMEQQEAFCCQIQELKAKLCTSEALKEKTEMKALNLEEEGRDTKASDLAQLEQQQNENAKVVAAVKRDKYFLIIYF